MSKTVNIYNQAGLFVGPCPSTGFSFLTPDGILSNNYNDSTNINLVFPLHRITSFSYSVSPQRTEIRNLGHLANLTRPILSSPEITLNFSYYNMGLINEARLGFYVNHPSGSITGGSLYNQNVSPISGFYDRNYQLSNDTSQGWPLTTRDSRNIFVAIRNDMLDLHDPKNLNTNLNKEIGVLAFGDCFITSYKTSCSVGQFPVTTLQYVSDNYIYYSSGSGNNIPSIHSKTYNLNSGIYFNIPNPTNENNLPTILLPTNISLSIKEENGNNPSNYSFDFDDIRIQNYQISMNLNRDYLYGLSNVLPLDKRIKFPIINDLSFDLVPGQSQVGNLVDLIKEDSKYNITITLNYDRNQPLSGPAIQYIFLGAKFNGFSPQLSISNYETSTLSFTTEMDIINPSGGFFISGQLGVLNYGNATDSVELAINNTGDRLLMQDDSFFTIYPSGGINNTIIY